MTGLPRFAPKPTLLFALAALAAMPFLGVRSAMAQDAPIPVNPVTVSPELKSAVESYWHYGKIARYDLAALAGGKITASNAAPLEVLSAFEQVAAAGKDADRMDYWLLRWQGIEQMREVTDQVNKLIAEGYRARRSDPAFINGQISRLTVNERAYGLAMTRLRESGELAVPFLIQAISDPAKQATQPTYRRALRDMGRYALNPLVAATETKDWNNLPVMVSVLGDLGYDAASPYIARLVQADGIPVAVKAAAAEALARLGAIPTQPSSASDQFFALGERFYNQESSITADTRFPMANVWYCGDQGLSRKEVPHSIFNDIMAMRSAEYTLKLGGDRSDAALSLWLAANYKREADLPEGGTDATRPENYPSAHYWGVEAGPKYLNVALGRALGDHNSAVAYRAIRSMQEIGGQSNLFTGDAGSSLISAMHYPDRKVRFEAAFALAAALPQTQFEGQQRVIPLLAEAIAQTGQSSVLVVLPAQDAVNKLVDELKTAGFAAAGATSAGSAITQSAMLHAVDVILVSEDIGAGRVEELFNAAAQDPRLAGAGRLVITTANASMYEQRKTMDQLLSTTTATDAAGLQPAIEAARAKSGALPLDPEVATDYARRAGGLMLKVGISRGQIFDLSPAKSSLLAGLDDKRPEIVMLAGQVLALLNDTDAQAGLLATASEDTTADDLKISLYKSLATSAKFYGNRLSADQIDTLQKVVAGAPNLDVRSAAAEARGALNLPADQAKSLIVSQSKT